MCTLLLEKFAFYNNFQSIKWANIFFKQEEQRFTTNLNFQTSMKILQLENDSFL